MPLLPSRLVIAVLWLIALAVQCAISTLRNTIPLNHIRVELLDHQRVIVIALVTLPL